MVNKNCAILDRRISNCHSVFLMLSHAFKNCDNTHRQQQPILITMNPEIGVKSPLDEMTRC